RDPDPGQPASDRRTAPRRRGARRWRRPPSGARWTMRAAVPLAEGDVARDGVRLHWEQYGEGDTTIALLPTWSIIDSRHWKFQLPYLARHHRVVVFDGRGCGRSDRPANAAAYTHMEFAADTIAVLDATGTERAVLVSFSCGALWALQVAADHPDRVA